MDNDIDNQDIMAIYRRLRDAERRADRAEQNARELETENARLRTILQALLFATVSFRDLIGAGYTTDEANAIMGEFGKETPGA